MPAKLIRSHPVIEVRDGYVICGGVHRTATLHLDPEKSPPPVGETHQMLRPVFHDGDYQAAAEVHVGDAIDELEDGSKVHRPIAKHE